MHHRAAPEFHQFHEPRCTSCGADVVLRPAGSSGFIWVHAASRRPTGTAWASHPPRTARGAAPPAARLRRRLAQVGQPIPRAAAYSVRVALRPGDATRFEVRRFDTATEALAVMIALRHELTADEAGFDLTVARDDCAIYRWINYPRQGGTGIAAGHDRAACRSEHAAPDVLDALAKDAANLVALGYSVDRRCLAECAPRCTRRHLDLAAALAGCEWTYLRAGRDVSR